MVVLFTIEEDLVGVVGADEDLLDPRNMILSSVYSQDRESVEVRRLANRGLGRCLEVLLLNLTGNRALVTEDEVDLSFGVN